jgi:hypothetical protein
MVPTKAAYRLFETDPEFEFEFYLAQKLSMTVGELRERMSQHEFLYWNVYYGRIAQRQELERLKQGGAGNG